ncbi:MAG: lysophospholipid acyltransferase family protein [Acidimicrobiia bacterium]|nr:lysophospholipid acyltransferase family protein [Acidimicrobiia bacterium]
MPRAPKFRFEPAPDLPGADTVTRVGLAAIRQMVYRLWDVTVEGVEHVPLEGPAILAPNHLSFCDSVFLPAALPRRAWAIGKAEYMDDWKTKHLFPALGMIPVDRSGGDAAKAALDTAARVLDGGHLFTIFPEGTRSRSGNLHRGRTGAARLAARCDAPIIPVGLIGTVAIQPPDQFLMKTNLPCTVRFGEPLRIEEFGRPSDPRVFRAMTDAVMYRISQLSGQEYVDTYAGKAPEQTPVAPAPPPTTPRPSVPPNRAPALSTSSAVD